ncbi:hypothetical protein Tco_1189792 [Tanacetum coccineum]
MGDSSSQPHTEQLMSLIYAFPTEDMYPPQYSDSFQHTATFQHTVRENSPVEVVAPQRIRSQLEDAQRGQLKTRLHPGRLHEQMRKKLRCVKIRFAYPKTAELVTRGRMLDFGLRFYSTLRAKQRHPVVESTRCRRRRLLRKALLDYEAEHRMPFTLRHLTRDALNHMEALKAEIMAKWNLPY